jgi:hypothetical protein
MNEPQSTVHHGQRPFGVFFQTRKADNLDSLRLGLRLLGMSSPHQRATEEQGNGNY